MAARVAVPTLALLAGYLTSTTLLSLLGVPALPTALLTAALLLGVFALVVGWWEQRPAVELGRSGAGRELVGGLALGAALCAVTVGILALLGVYHVDGLNPLGVLWPAVASAVLAGVFEELLTRGVLFRVLERAQGTWVALAVSAAVFGALHLVNPGATVTGAAAIAVEAGLLLGLAYVATGRLWLPIGLHIAWNATTVGVFGSPASGVPFDGLLQGRLTGPSLLSGAGFGVDGSIVTVLACLGVAALLLRSARRNGRIVARNGSPTAPRP
ncbi:CPBP family intramembrane glutamic endopeptidase [Pseudonocardia sp. MH-G8]|uniref:CPBP family intramembrane glutamic endopeptidase n=1 Tax=Pseudonocardia sp. MH-G8 TaxID=1854588 RepID=UPI001179BA15|nr:CPBP family intramembrane glutamic endopeptidase [Pseudonocardia sp. MH-G8]